METHTFIAETANEAVDRIRAELGPSAVVLSVRKLPRSGLSRLLKQEQIEVVARAADTALELPRDPFLEIRDELRTLRQQVAALQLTQTARSGPQFSPSSAELEVAGRKPASTLDRILIQTGLLPIFSERILQELPPVTAADGLANQVQAVQEILRGKWRGEEPRPEAGVHLFVGVPGAGKSTALCKMLAQTSLLEKQPAAIFQLDAHVANASPQPAIFGEIMNAHFERSAPICFERREGNVFVDLPGVALNDEKGLEAVRSLTDSFGVPQTHLVLNGAYESSHLLEQARFFAALGISDLIITHLDEEKRWGKIWNLVLGTKYNVRFLSAGQNIPGDFLAGSADLVLARQFCGK